MNNVNQITQNNIITNIEENDFNISNQKVESIKLENKEILNNEYFNCLNNNNEDKNININININDNNNFNNNENEIDDISKSNKNKPSSNSK